MFVLLRSKKNHFGERRRSWGLRRMHASLLVKVLVWVLMWPESIFLWILVLWWMIPQGILVLHSIGLVHKNVLDFTPVTILFWSNASQYTNPPARRFGIPIGTPLVIASTRRNTPDPYIQSFFTWLIHFLNGSLNGRWTDLRWVNIRWDGIEVPPSLSL